MIIFKPLLKNDKRILPIRKIQIIFFIVSHEKDKTVEDIIFKDIRDLSRLKTEIEDNTIK